MLSWLVGNVDVPAAGVLIAMFVAMAIVATTFLTLYSSKQETANKFELAKMAQSAGTARQDQLDRLQHEKDLAQIAMKREVEIKRIDSGLVDLKVAQQVRRSDYDNEG